MKKETKPLWFENPDRLVEELKPEACHVEAFAVEKCLRDSDFDVRRCLDEVATLHACCGVHQYKSKHCAPMSGLLKDLFKPGEEENILQQGTMKPAEEEGTQQGNGRKQRNAGKPEKDSK
ncbi:hypothetical protein KFL_000750250 [Klebsormidium nitens]|uniref:Uncharacterized protein n=1 Tax=Klebsormidium nitens TaxID=105231 RepID=A0A0U9HIX8_KLENI|nr:hypothetical protein KFL_000750250 [Klebsormidium nitens]|eukprot:GAQ81257.1 hypothetical protein KFL_000750250 [Klebsormidium nitens]